MTGGMDPGTLPAGPAGILLAAIEAACYWAAVLGGAVLAALTLLMVVSVTGRYLLAAPVPGDTEIASMMTAIAVALFLPYTEIRKGHVIVDVFTAGAPPRVRALLDAVASLGLCAFSALLCWRAWLGMHELMSWGDETMVLRLPSWIGLVPVVPAFGLLALASVATFIRHFRRAFSPPVEARPDVRP